MSEQRLIAATRSRAWPRAPEAMSRRRRYRIGPRQGTEEQYFGLSYAMARKAPPSARSVAQPSKSLSKFGPASTAATTATCR